MFFFTILWFYFFNIILHFSFLLSSYLHFFFLFVWTYLFDRKEFRILKYSVKANLENMERWRFAFLSHQFREVASLITGSTDCAEPTKFVWKTLRLLRMHIHIELIKAKINFLLIHDVIIDSYSFFFSTSSSARRQQNLLPPFLMPPYVDITIGVKQPCWTSNIRCNSSFFFSLSWYAFEVSM